MRTTLAVFAVAALAATFALAALAAPDDSPAAAPADLLKASPANTWVKIVQTRTGSREQPIFVYAANLKKFVMASGIQSTGGAPPRHYDTEEFDLASGKWINAYPAGVAGSRPESGPVGQDYSKLVEMIGHNGRQPFYKDGEYQRLTAGGQWAGYRTGYEWCYNPDNGLVYAYIDNMTLAYDPAKRTWTDLKAAPRTSNRIWGTMVYDPVNKEIVHVCGDGGTVDLGTWVYGVEKNEWRKLEQPKGYLATWRHDADGVVWQAKVLLGAVINRFTVAETEAEAKADLKAKATEVSTAVTTLATAVGNGRLTPPEIAAGELAAKRLNEAGTALKAVAEKLTGKITPEIIAEVRAIRVLLEQAADAVAPEPPGRARIQVAYDPEHKKIVLFGGDQLDRVLADTWLYDCATRTWEQKFPKACPSPRAGYVCAWLPKAKQVVLAGGYSRDWLPQEIWTYDVAANEWRPLASVPLVTEGGRDDLRKYSPNCPLTGSRGTQCGAVTEDDVLVCVSPGGGMTTWACKIDPAKPGATADKAVAGKSGDYTFNRMDPADWEKVANPDAEKMKKFYADLPVNQWTAVKFARYAPGATNRWGTTAYDPQRHQFLFWGGGHATSHENDVAHFSVLGGCWTIGYHPDDPIETVYAEQPTPLSFHDRAHVPIHAYKGYCYDSTSGKMLFFSRAYNVAAREWEAAGIPGLKHRGTMHSHMEPTPGGAVTFSAEGLFRFDAKTNAWVKLPWAGPNPGDIWCDGDSLLYDSKRNCLWLTNKGDIYKYDLAAGKAEKVAYTKPKALGGFVFHGEEVYLPDADLILLMTLFKDGQGRLRNVVWNPTDLKFYWADLKFVADGKEVAFNGNPFSWHDALHYDPALKLVVMNNSSAKRVWALKFDRETAKLEEMKD